MPKLDGQRWIEPRRTLCEFRQFSLAPVPKELFWPATSPGVEPALLEALVRLGERLSMGGVDPDRTWVLGLALFNLGDALRLL